MWMTKAECYTPELFAKLIITQGCNLCFLFHSLLWVKMLIVVVKLHLPTYLGCKRLLQNWLKGLNYQLNVWHLYLRDPSFLFSACKTTLKINHIVYIKIILILTPASFPFTTLGDWKILCLVGVDTGADISVFFAFWRKKNTQLKLF